MRAALVLALAACGSRPSPAPPVIGPPAAFEPTPAPDDVVVAQVNGHPVYGACVQGQAARGADRKAALDQCIDFELMAQAAQRFATNPDVIEATHTAMVSELVASDYEDAYTEPAQFGGNWQMFVGRNLFHVRHEEYRASSYVRVVVPDKATPAEDAAAHALADKLAARFADERGLVGPEMLAIAQPLAGNIKLAHEDVEPYRVGALDPGYAKALFAIPEIGRTAPDAVRTKWGWDVVAYTGDVPAADPSDAEVASALMPDVKRGFFTLWVERIRKQLGIHVELVPDNIAKLEGR
jgi:hypothetical protein